jgi:hypothetical protein
MPRKATNYANGIQYKIVCKDPTITDCYNGSCVSFKDRKNSHKNQSLNPNCKAYNFKVYRFIRDNGGWENWTFIQLEEFPCKSKQELVLRERHWFDIIKPTLNSQSPMTTPQERKHNMVKYANEHKVEISANKQKYHSAHRVDRLAKQKQYVREHKVEVAVYKKQHYTEHRDEIVAYKRQYYADNNATILAKVAQYKEEHRAEINAKQREKVTCECGCEVSKSSLSRHQKSKTHLHIMNQLK